MDENSLIIGALSAGLVAVSRTTASYAVKDSYKFLKDLIKRRLEKYSLKGDESEAIKSLSNFERDPKLYETLLIEKLSKAEVERDQEIIQAAKNLMELVMKSRDKVQIEQSLNITGQVNSIQNIGNIEKGVKFVIKHSKE